ncbi:MAG: glycyl radical protein, partial [Oscillospiraceae bacterium]|nr:glycyl radical protein [Oscillospiraceae bacterium]
GVPTGYLYEMESIEEVFEAYKKQIEFFVKWHVGCTNSFEYVARQNLPLPVASATMEGCMESGRDVMWGGAKYNSTGLSGVGIGNVVDSIHVIDYLCFKTKKCTTRELYDAVMANWEGYEELQRYIKNEVPRYGNAVADVDKWAKRCAKVFSDAVNRSTGLRGRYSAGLYPVTTNLIFGTLAEASPDGRNRHELLADGISPVQQMDKNGPTAVLCSTSCIDQVDYPNGTLLNMKFHPSAANGDEGLTKVAQLIQTYFSMGGMEMQLNFISSETLRDALKNPQDHQSLVVRVAGFSAYFVELHDECKMDLITRTELML